MTDPRTIAVAFLVCAALALISGAASVIFWIMLRKCKHEIRRLVGKVNGFEISDIRAHPEMMVCHLRSDANLCDFAGQKDMASRLRGYATICERWLDDKERGNALRRIEKDRGGYQPATGLGDSPAPKGGSGVSRR